MKILPILLPLASVADNSGLIVICMGFILCSLNESLSSASLKSLKHILKVTNEKLVSIDFNHNNASAIIDASLTNVIGNKMGKISAWYDNEWGFSNRMCDIAKYISKIK